MAGSYHKAQNHLALRRPDVRRRDMVATVNRLLTDPYPIANELRDEHSVFWSEQLGHVLSPTDLIEEVL